jgi:hypothetical protein
MNATDGPFHGTAFPLPIADIDALGTLVDLHAALSAAPAPDPLRSPTPCDFLDPAHWGDTTPPHLWSALRYVPDAELALLTTVADFYLLSIPFVSQLKDEATLRARYRTVADWFATNDTRWTVGVRCTYQGTRGGKPGMLYCTAAEPTWLDAPVKDPTAADITARITVGALMDIPLPPVSQSEPTAAHRISAAYAPAIRLLLDLPVSTTDIINSPVAAAMAAALGRTDLLVQFVCGSINYALVPAAAAAFNQVGPLEMYVRNRPLIFGLRWTHFSTEEATVIRQFASAHGSKEVLDFMDRVCPPDHA